MIKFFCKICSSWGQKNKTKNKHQTVGITQIWLDVPKNFLHTTVYLYMEVLTIVTKGLLNINKNEPKSGSNHFTVNFIWNL